MVFKKGEMQKSGLCAYCGAKYKVKYEIKEREVFHRDYDGRPSDFTLDDIIHNTYTTMCEKCGNVSIDDWDRLCENKYNLNHIIDTKEYQEILRSNEPLAVKQLRLLVLKYKDSPLFDMLPSYTIDLIWYYDFINNRELFEYYAKLFISYFDKKSDLVPMFEVVKEYKMKTRGTFKPTGKKVKEIPLLAFYLIAQHIKMDLYRRLGDFETALKELHDTESKIVTPSHLRGNIDIFLQNFKKLCEERNSDRQPIPPLTHL